MSIPRKFKSWKGPRKVPPSRFSKWSLPRSRISRSWWAFIRQSSFSKIPIIESKCSSNRMSISFAEMETNVTRILKIVQNDDLRKRGRNSKKDEELAGLVESIYSQSQSLYALYDHLVRESSARTVRARQEIDDPNSSSTSDSEYYSSEELENGHRKLSGHEGSFAQVNGSQGSVHIGELEEQLAALKENMESSDDQKRELRAQIEDKVSESRQLVGENSSLRARISNLESILKDREEKLSSLGKKHRETKKSVSSKFADEKGETSKFESEVIEEGMALRESDASRRRKGVMEQTHVLGCVKNAREVAEARIEGNSEELSKRLFETEARKQAAENPEFQNKMVEEEEGFFATMEEQTQEMKSLEKLRERELNLQVAKRKVEEIGAEFCKRLEDGIRVLNRRILVVEQLQSENKDSLRVVKNRYHQETRALTEKVSKLEAKVNMEEGERLDFLQKMAQLEKQVDGLEQGLKDRDERLLSLGEEKREAIRQLCFVADYHRSEWDHLKGWIAKMRTTEKTTRLD